MKSFLTVVLGIGAFLFIGAEASLRTNTDSSSYFREQSKMNERNRQLYKELLNDPALEAKRLKDVPLDPERASLYFDNPKMVDWRTKGVITPVVQQGSCASCWAFVAAANLASQWAIEKGMNTTVPLSEQELLSCDKDTGNEGCRGGLMTYAYNWYIKHQNGNAVTEESYPYVSGGDGIVPSCDWKGAEYGANIESYNVLPKNETAIAHYVLQYGPVGVAIDDYLLSSYQKGTILSGCNNASSGINHAVMVVGYNDEHNPPYWIVKNSWGKLFGEEGYFYLEKGHDECGIRDIVSAPVVAKHASIAPSVAPPPPTPAPSVTPHWVQSLCTKPGCSTSCGNESFPLNTCVSSPNFGNSMISTCNSTYVTTTTYVSSTKCEGDSYTSSSPTNKCFKLQPGQYLQEYCVDGKGEVSGEENY